MGKNKKFKIEDTQTVKRHPMMVHAQGHVSRIFTVLKNVPKGRFKILRNLNVTRILKNSLKSMDFP